MLSLEISDLKQNQTIFPHVFLPQKRLLGSDAQLVVHFLLARRWLALTVTLCPNIDHAARAISQLNRSNYSESLTAGGLAA